MKVNCKGCNHENCVYVGMNNNTVCKDYVPLNPAPQQRTWVGLTDSEIAEIYMSNTDKSLPAKWDFAKAIEAKLKEKNTRNGGCL